MSQIDYEAVLDNLRKRRDELDAAISAMEMLLAVMPEIAQQALEQPAPPAGALVWTEQAPKDNGYYWWRRTPHEDTPTVLRVSMIPGHGLYASSVYDNVSKNVSELGGQWSSGPLAPPRDGGQE